MALKRTGRPRQLECGLDRIEVTPQPGGKVREQRAVGGVEQVIQVLPHPMESIAFSCLAHVMATPSAGSSVSSRATNRASGSDNVALLAISTRASFRPVGACQSGAAAELAEGAVSGSVRRRSPAQRRTMFWPPLKPSATNSRQSWAALRHPSAQRRCTTSR